MKNPFPIKEWILRPGKKRRAQNDNAQRLEMPVISSEAEAFRRGYDDAE